MAEPLKLSSKEVSACDGSSRDRAVGQRAQRDCHRHIGDLACGHRVHIRMRVHTVLVRETQRGRGARQSHRAATRQKTAGATDAAGAALRQQRSADGGRHRRRRRKRRRGHPRREQCRSRRCVRGSSKGRLHGVRGEGQGRAGGSHERVVVRERGPWERRQLVPRILLARLRCVSNLVRCVGTGTGSQQDPAHNVNRLLVPQAAPHPVAGHDDKLVLLAQRQARDFRNSDHATRAGITLPWWPKSMQGSDPHHQCRQLPTQRRIRVVPSDSRLRWLD